MRRSVTTIFTSGAKARLPRAGALAAALGGLALVAALATANAKPVHHKAAPASPYARQCAALWPRYLAADIKFGQEEFDDTLTPAQIELHHRVFLGICLTQGPNAPDIQSVLGY
jgi:hypothetical protein